MTTSKCDYLLRRIPLLADLTADELHELSSLLVEEEYPEGIVIFEENSAGDAFFIIKSGRVEVIKKIHGYEDNAIILGEITDFFGEMALLEHMPRSATVRTLEPTSTLKMEQKDFNSLLARSPRAYYQLARALSSRLRDVHDTFIQYLQVKNTELQSAYNDLKETQARLIAKEKLASLGMAAARIIHDIKNPMTGILAYADLIRFRSPESTHYVNFIMREVERLSDMLQELMDFAQGNDTKLSVDRHNLDDFINELILLVQSIIGQRPIHLETDVQYRDDVLFDMQKLRRALHNLLVNAVEALPPHGGTVRMQVHAEGGGVVFRIFDSGAGIPDAIAERAFEPFVTHGKPRGTGLGLAICKNIVEAHRGTITVDHVPEVGTTFVVKLPECLATPSR